MVVSLEKLLERPHTLVDSGKVERWKKGSSYPGADSDARKQIAVEHAGRDIWLQKMLINNYASPRYQRVLIRA